MCARRSNVLGLGPLRIFRVGLSINALLLEKPCHAALPPAARTCGNKMDRPGCSAQTAVLALLKLINC